MRAALRPASIAVGETTLLEVTIRTPGGEPESVRIPSLAGGLAVVGTRQSEQYRVSIPGGRTRVISREIHLRARREGRYAIPPIVVEYDGRRYASRPLTLDVGAAPAPAAVPDGAASASGDVVLRSTIVPDTVFVGEQVTLRSDALFADQVRSRMRQAPEYLAPSPSGLWTYDLPDVRGARFEWQGPRRYEVHRFQRAYFPIEPGTFEIPPARLVYEVRRGFLQSTTTEELETQPLQLIVQPLPDSAVPPSFNGAVGRFTVEASISPDSVAVGGAAVLTLRVTGEGNIKTLPAPDVTVPGATLEPPSQESDFSGAGGRITGTKTFRWVIVPERPGLLRLGRIGYAHFDPDAGAYRVARSDSLVLRVTPGAAVATTGSQDAPAGRLRPLARAPDRPPRSPAPAWLALLAAAPYVLLGGVLWGRSAWERRRRAPSARALRRRLRVRLAELRRDQDASARPFHTALESAAIDWLAARTGRDEMRRLRGDALAHALIGAGASEPIARRVADLLHRVTRAQFRPVPPPYPERVALLERLEQALLQVDRSLPRKPGRSAERNAGRRSAGRATVAAVVALGATTAVLAGGAGQQDTVAAAPAPAAVVFAGGAGRYEQEAAPRVSAGEDAAPESGFAAGLRLFSAGRRDEAAQAFAAYVRRHPQDAAAWYNLGTVQASLGRTGEAVAALLESLHVDPTRDAAMHNLRVLNVDQEWIDAARPWPPVRQATFRWILVALAWAGALVLSAFRLRTGVGGWSARALLIGAVPPLLASGMWAAREVDTRGHPAVMLRRAPLRAAPELHAPPVGTSEAGSVGWRVDDRGQWLRVRIPGGPDGWIEAADVSVVGGSDGLSSARTIL